MDHIARYDRLQRIVAEAAQFRTLREVVKSDRRLRRILQPCCAGLSASTTPLLLTNSLLRHERS
jgi:hypothetical protein